MPTVIQKGLPKSLSLIGLIPESIRDLLLSLPEEERTFIISKPQAGFTKVKNIYLKEIGREVILIIGGD